MASDKLTNFVFQLKAFHDNIKNTRITRSSKIGYLKTFWRNGRKATYNKTKDKV